MLEFTQETLERIDPLLDAGDVEQAGKLLFKVDKISLRALLIHILQERGAMVADLVGNAYLHEREIRSAI